MTTIAQKLTAAGISAALPLIVLFEGTRQTAYLDPVGIPTICRGHTGPEVKLGQNISLQQCDDLTVKDLLKAKAAMQSCVTVPLNNNQRAAFTSFVFNVGPGQAGVKDGFCQLKNGKPSTMVTLLNQRDYTGACNQLLHWNKANGQVLNGLTKRRKAEHQLCLSPPN